MKSLVEKLSARACAEANPLKPEVTISVFRMRVKGPFGEENRLEQVIDASSL